MTKEQCHCYDPTSDKVYQANDLVEKKCSNWLVFNIFIVSSKLSNYSRYFLSTCQNGVLNCINVAGCTEQISCPNNQVPITNTSYCQKTCISGNEHKHCYPAELCGCPSGQVLREDV